MDNQKKPFEKPELIIFGKLGELTGSHKDDNDPQGNAWGHYKDSEADGYSPGSS